MNRNIVFLGTFMIIFFVLIYIGINNENKIQQTSKISECSQELRNYQNQYKLLQTKLQNVETAFNNLTKKINSNPKELFFYPSYEVKDGKRVYYTNLYRLKITMTNNISDQVVLREETNEYTSIGIYLKGELGGDNNKGITGYQVIYSYRILPPTSTLDNSFKLIKTFENGYKLYRNDNVILDYILNDDGKLYDDIKKMDLEIIFE